MCDTRLCPRWIDLAGPLARVLLGQHRRNRHIGKGRISHVPLHVGIGELLCFDEGVQRVRRIVGRFSEDRQCLEDVQHHQRRNARAVRRQLEHAPAAIRRRNGLGPLGAEVRQVGLSHHRAAPLEARDDPPCDLSAVKGVAAVRGDLAVRPRQIDVAEYCPEGKRDGRRAGTFWAVSGSLPRTSTWLCHSSLVISATGNPSSASAMAGSSRRAGASCGQIVREAATIRRQRRAR